MHCGLFVGDPFYKFGFMCLAELLSFFLFFAVLFLFFFYKQNSQGQNQIEMWLNAAAKAEVKHQFIQNRNEYDKKYIYILKKINQTVNILKMQPALGEIDYAYIIYRSGYESQNSRECFPMASIGIFNLAMHTPVSTRI